MQPEHPPTRSHGVSMPLQRRPRRTGSFLQVNQGGREVEVGHASGLRPGCDNRPCGGVLVGVVPFRHGGASVNLAPLHVRGGTCDVLCSVFGAVDVTDRRKLLQAAASALCPGGSPRSGRA